MNPLDLILNKAKSVVNSGKKAVMSFNPVVRFASTMFGLGKNKINKVKNQISTETGAFSPERPLGIASNTIRGLPSTALQIAKNIPSAAKQIVTKGPAIAKEMFASDRGYDLMSPNEYVKSIAYAKTPQERAEIQRKYKEQRPTFSETLKAGPKLVSEIFTFGGDLLATQIKPDSVLGRLSSPSSKVGEKLANVGAQITNFGKPKTAGEANAMKALDIITNMPVFGGVKNIMSAKYILSKAKTISKLDDPVAITKELAEFGSSKEELKKAMPYLIDAKDPKRVEEILKMDLGIQPMNSSVDSGLKLDRGFMPSKIAEKMDDSDIKTLSDFIKPDVTDEQHFNGTSLLEQMGINGAKNSNLEELQKVSQEIINEYRAIKSTLPEVKQPRDKIGRFDVKPKPTPPVYQGEKDLTVKTLEKLKGRSTVSKQFISDLTNSADLKQSERDLIREALATEKGDTINVTDFAKKVKAETLPLKTKSSDLFSAKKNKYGEDMMLEEGSFTPKWESVNMDESLRGNVASYRENTYESPITTSAGDVHYGYTTKNYFGHTRIEDMADNKTRRVIEVQSDLYQKGNLEREVKKPSFRPLSGQDKELAEIDRFGNTVVRNKGETQKLYEQRLKEVSKLQQYNDPTAHFRMIREEIKKAAQDGKTKLQFPTGETAMKIEGLGETSQWRELYENIETPGGSRPSGSRKLKPENLEVGMRIGQEQPDFGGGMSIDSEWIITDVLGDGKFKAVPKRLSGTAEDMNKFIESGQFDKIENFKESFDISGKVDTNNPIYKFYEKEVGRYLSNKYKAKLVTDAQGVKWWEVDVNPAMAKAPVEAFGGVAGFEQDEEGNLKFNPYKAVGGVLGIHAVNKVKGKFTGKGKPMSVVDEIAQSSSQTKTIGKTTEVISTPLEKITDALKRAKPLTNEQKKLYSAERGQRVARVAGVAKNVGGEKGYFAQLGQLKGELPKVDFEGIRADLKQTDIDELFNQAENANVTVFEKISAKSGLSKILNGQLPNKSEISILKEIFPEELIKAIQEKQPMAQKLFGMLGNVLNLPRSIMATADLSAPLRQGIFLVGRPKQWLPAFRDMFKYALNEKAYDGLMTNIRSRPNYLKMRESKLALTDMSSDLTSREELFMSNLAEKIPIFGKVAKASNRAYSGFLNKLRADVFDDLLKKANELGVVESRPDVIKDIAKFVNSASGRGDLGSLNKASTVLNGIFFSPRLMASRLNLLNPVYYAKLDPFVRKEALKSLFTFAGTALTVLGLSKLAGAEVETDPRSADFAKAKFGNTRYDVLGGFQQYVRLASQLASGKIISSTTGREITLGEGYKPLTRKDVLTRFIESKEAPVLSFATALMTGKTGMGEDLNIPTEVINRSIPLVVQDMYNLASQRGLDSLGMALPAIFGVGSQTYGEQELVKGKDSIGLDTAQIKPKTGLAEGISKTLFGQKKLGPTAGYSVEAYYDQLLKLPREEASAKFDEIVKANPDLAKKLTQVAKDRQLGITVDDQTLRAKGIQNGDRARSIVEKLNKLKTKEEKAKLWEDYTKKKIINKEVSEQVSKLLSQKKTSNNDEGIVSRYAEAVIKDPSNALKALFTKEKLGKVEGNLVELQRFYGIKFTDKGGSQEYKKKRMEEMGIPWTRAGDYKLEHIVPVSAGGDNSDGNLVPVSNDEHNMYTPIDIAIGNAVKLGKLTRKEASELMRKLKIEKSITVEDIYNSIK